MSTDINLHPGDWVSASTRTFEGGADPFVTFEIGIEGGTACLYLRKKEDAVKLLNAATDAYVALVGIEANKKAKEAEKLASQARVWKPEPVDAVLEQLLAEEEEIEARTRGSYPIPDYGYDGNDDEYCSDANPCDECQSYRKSTSDDEWDF